MSVLLETSIGEIVLDLFCKDAPLASLNFLSLCKLKYFNNCLVHNVQKNYIAQSGDPSIDHNKSSIISEHVKLPSSAYGIVNKDPKKRYFNDQLGKNKTFNRKGIVACANMGPDLNTSTFFITLTDLELPALNQKHTIFGQVVEGLDIVEKLNNVYIDGKTERPIQNIRIKHTVVIDEGEFDPELVRNLLPGIDRMIPSRSPSPVRQQKRVVDKDGKVNYEIISEQSQGNISDDVDINHMMESMTEEQIKQRTEEHEVKQRTQVLEIINDLPDADIEPPKNILFVCKLNPVTQEHDLELIFSRFGNIKSCEIVRDWKTSDSLQYAFIEFENEANCIQAYLKMDGVLIDERRIHVDFSQSVAKQWNQHRKSKLKDAAQQIISDEQKQIQQQKNLLFPYMNKERKTSRSRSPKRDEGRSRRRSISRERKDDRRRRSRSTDRRRYRDDQDSRRDRRHYHERDHQDSRYRDIRSRSKSRDRNRERHHRPDKRR